MYKASVFAVGGDGARNARADAWERHLHPSTVNDERFPCYPPLWRVTTATTPLAHSRPLLMPQNRNLSLFTTLAAIANQAPLSTAEPCPPAAYAYLGPVCRVSWTWPCEVLSSHRYTTIPSQIKSLPRAWHAVESSANVAQPLQAPVGLCMIVSAASTLFEHRITSTCPGRRLA